MIRVWILSVMLLAAVGCSAERQSGSHVLAEAAQREFGTASYACADTVAVAKTAGVDYEPVVDRCLAGDRRAMHVLFRLSRDAGFDAASGQGHAAVLGSLLRRLGDAFFSGCLSKEPAEVQRAVRDDIVYDFGYDPPVNEIPTLKRDFPKTFPATYRYE